MFIYYVLSGLLFDVFIEMRIRRSIKPEEIYVWGTNLLAAVLAPKDGSGERISTEKAMLPKVLANAWSRRSPDVFLRTDLQTGLSRVLVRWGGGGAGFGLEVGPTNITSVWSSRAKEWIPGVLTFHW